MLYSAIVRTTKTVHRYLGLFFAPAILFFSFSGAFQTLGLHSAGQGSGYIPARWIVQMAQLHKKQTLSVPTPKTKTPTNGQGDVTVSPVKRKASTSKRALQFFVVLMSIALMATTFLGITMAFMYGGDRRMTVLALLAGTFFPISVILL
jgi:uncharacterized iron-regulated membrane protein